MGRKRFRSIELSEVVTTIVLPYWLTKKQYRVRARTDGRPEASFVVHGKMHKRVVLREMGWAIWLGFDTALSRRDVLLILLPPERTHEESLRKIQVVSAPPPRGRG